MANIEVQRSGHDTYSVTVTESGSESSYVVTAADTTAGERGVSGERLVSASIRFLLDREPKESILSRFDLGVIGGYFPEYATVIDDYLRA